MTPVPRGQQLSVDTSVGHSAVLPKTLHQIFQRTSFWETQFLILPAPSSHQERYLRAMRSKNGSIQFQIQFPISKANSTSKSSINQKMRPSYEVPETADIFEPNEGQDQLGLVSIQCYKTG